MKRVIITKRGPMFNDARPLCDVLAESLEHAKHLKHLPHEAQLEVWRLLKEQRRVAIEIARVVREHAGICDHERDGRNDE